jgi:hypothetical protein
MIRATFSPLRAEAFFFEKRVGGKISIVSFLRDAASIERFIRANPGGRRRIYMPILKFITFGVTNQRVFMSGCGNGWHTITRARSKSEQEEKYGSLIEAMLQMKKLGIALIKYLSYSILNY